MDTNFLALAEVELRVKLALVKQNSVWQPVRWSVMELLPAEAMVTDLEKESGVFQNLVLRVYQDELQGYFLNLDAENPCLSFLVRHPDEDVSRLPTVVDVTASYDVAARWMDSNENVQTLPMPGVMAAWLAELVQARYQPEPKRRRRPQSFVSPGERYNHE
ncbi:DUF3305 domain-containing protein [Limnobacter sp.]|uniref:DUF3305 domain-containing protein n=1 Tax=Limnobacter sp. TaxID=2003368 RepID=UPI002E2F2AD6|nr:DUF3305 domain-containing protein [Limnobacter sp.]